MNDIRIFCQLLLLKMTGLISVAARFLIRLGRPTLFTTTDWVD